MAAGRLTSVETSSGCRPCFCNQRPNFADVVVNDTLLVGNSAAISLRHFIKSVLGIRSERLPRYGMKPRRGALPNVVRTFKDLGLQDPQRSPLTARNQSILAHGFQPIGTNVFNQLWSAAVELGSFTEAELPTFPRLAEPRAASA